MAITIDDFKQLSEIRNDLCISIYIPTYRAGQEVLEDKHKIKFKNEIKEVKKELQQRNYSPREIENLLKPAEKLMNDIEFWSHQEDGLAFFLTKDFWRHYTLPKRVESMHFIGGSFYLLPLVTAIDSEERFYILDLNLNKVKLYKAGNTRISQIDISGFVEDSLEEAVSLDEKEKQLQYQSMDSKIGGRDAVYHGHGQGRDIRLNHLRKFFSMVDNALRDNVLRGSKDPIVLAGVEYLLPVYREVSHYGHLAKKTITGNQEHRQLGELHKDALVIIEEEYNHTFDISRKRMEELLGTGIAETNLENVVKNSYYGLVSDLFLSNGRQIWGKYYESTDRIEIHNKRQEDDICLLDFAATNTKVKGGNVFVVPDSELPDANSPVAAIFRNKSMGAFESPQKPPSELE